MRATRGEAKDPARYTDDRRHLIDPTVEHWRERCLIDEGSLLSNDRDGVWTLGAATVS